jgi:hypothetical protein
MKKYSHKHIHFLSLKSRKQIEVIRKRRDKVYSPSFIYKHYPKEKFVNVKAPRVLNLDYSNAGNTVNFIEKIKQYCNNRININLQLIDVTEFGSGAIAMLVSVLDEFNEKGVIFTGKEPLNSDARKTLQNSGFFKYVTRYGKKRIISNKNIILRRKGNTTDLCEIAPEVHKAMETVWGLKARCPLLFGGIGEIIRNSCDHAFNDRDSIVWHLEINHSENNNAVKFSLVDNGQGIIKTLNNKSFYESIKNILKDDAQILFNAFNNGIKSKTNLPWRGKGLPTIYEMYTDKVITNLVVVTNNVYIDFDKNIVSCTNSNYTGTYYYWQVNNSCTNYTVS